MKEQVIPCPECGSEDTWVCIMGFKLTVETPVKSNHTLSVYCNSCGKQTNGISLDSIKSDSLRRAETK